MAKTLIEDIMALLSPEEQTAFRAKLDANPALVVKAAKQRELHDIYNGDEEPTTTTTTTTPVVPVTTTTSTTEVHTPTVPSTVTGTSTATTSTSADSPLLAEIRALGSRMDTRMGEIEKKFVSVDKLPEYRTDILGAAIKASDDYAQVREDHRTEFGKPLDRTAFEKFVTDQREAGIRFKDMKAAHDNFVAKERQDAAIAKGIDDGLKQKRSGAMVPGQTQQVALSPAQEIIAKQKAAASASGDGKTNAMIAAEKLAKIVRDREASGSVQ
jgi:hypothetical protein